MKKLLPLKMTINGNDSDETLNGTNLADDIFGNGGNDTLNGLDGDDNLYGGTGNDTLNGGNGMDILRGEEGNDILFGNDGNDFLVGGPGNDIMVGGTGDDTYYVDSTLDAISEFAGEGNDRIATTITLALAADADIERIEVENLTSTNAIDITGSAIANIIYGNDGVNILRGEAGNDELRGFGGNDFLVGGPGTDVMIGGLGDDTFYVDDASDAIGENPGEGNDRIAASVSFVLSNGADVEIIEAVNVAATDALNFTGSDSANTITGNAGSNILRGEGGNDILNGAGGDDFLVGGAGNDVMNGGTGNDTYYVDSALDVVNEFAGEGTNDRVAASVSYALSATSDIELLEAANSADTTAINLTGSSIGQTIAGNAGANILNGMGGNDTLIGYGGADIFQFTTALGAGNVDTIFDFVHLTDKIELAGANGQPFAALASGTLRAGTLVIGTAAADADDYLIYNSATGALLYDADGNGAGAAVQFATLSTGLTLTVADFQVSGPANNAPAITSGGTASVAENSSASTIVYQTVANDADGDRITYSLTGTDAALLTIDANGAVRLINSANYEAKNSYSFNVVASDSAVATSKAVVLTITDVVEGTTPTINETAAANDTIGTAQSISPGALAVADNPDLYNDDFPSATIIGNISTTADVDYYSITLQAGQQLILDIDHTSGGLDSFLTLYKSDGTVIGDNDDTVSFDPGSNPPFGHNTDSQIIFRAGTSGTYYFSVKSFADDNGPTSSGGYQLNVSINSAPVTATQILAEDVQALVSGASWNHTNLTYGFPDQASYYPAAFEEVTPQTQFQAFNAAQITATRALLQMIANVSTLTFTENTTQGAYTTAGTAANADLRFAESSAADVAYAYYPQNQGPSDEGGSAWFNHTNFNTPTRGNYAFMGILHETGHTLGLKHGHEFPLAISADHDSVEYSVMTYRSYPGQDLSGGGGYTNEAWGYAQTLMMLDIAALQQIYNGANYAYNNTNSVYTWNETTGEMSINGVGQGAVGTGLGGTSNRVFMTIWDGGGNDTYNLSNYNGSSTIDLRPGEWTTTGTTVPGAQLANLGDGHFARGNIANALLFQGNTASAIENAIGGNGTDTLIANQVANQLTGGGSSDIFKWMATTDAGTGALADTVLDFSRGFDKIDFSNLDANPATGAHDAFTFIGTAAFSNVAGQVRYDVTGGSAHVFVDTDGNGSANMEIILTNITTLAGTDFNF